MILAVYILKNFKGSAKTMSVLCPRFWKCLAAAMPSAPLLPLPDFMLKTALDIFYTGQ